MTLLLALLACGSAPSPSAAGPAGPTPALASSAPAATPPAAPATPATPAVPAPTPSPPKVRAPTPSPSIDMNMAGAAARAWSKLIESGCDPSAGDTHVWTALEARVLRNVPFAMRGYSFSSADLTAFFSADGRAWYEGHSKDVVLPEAAATCVDRLKSHEQGLRAATPLDSALEGRLLQDATAFEALWGWGHASSDDPHGRTTLVRQADGGVMWMSTYPGCDHEDCGGYIITCPASGPCRAMAAG